MAINLPSQRGRGRRAPMADINVTPLVDVMLVLLIIFIITVPVMKNSVNIDLPRASSQRLAGACGAGRIALKDGSHALP